MNTRTKDADWALTEKEKETLRLIVRGHDAKSVARCLGLSVHTINERLRDARRKMEVPSSREAARLLLEVEGDRSGSTNPNLFGDAKIGEDESGRQSDQGAALIGAGQADRRPWIIGVLLMTFALGLLALAALPQTTSTPAPENAQVQEAPNSEVVDAARRWLVLVDQGRWDESYQATGTAFRKLNTAQVWANASERVRVPLGAMISRTLISQENLPGSCPAGWCRKVSLRGWPPSIFW